MKKITLLIVLSLSFITQSFALTEVIDPHGILPKTDAFLGENSFEDMVSCGERLEQRKENCYLSEGKQCEVNTIKTEIVNCSQNEVTLKTISAEGTEFEQFTKLDFLKTKGNTLRMFLAESLDLNNITVTLETITEMQTGDVNNLRSLILVEFLFDSCDDQGSCLQMNGEMTLEKGVPLLAQMMSFQLEYPNEFRFSLDAVKFTK